MISSSQLCTDATAAELRVAAALNACGCDGVGYFRFSLPRPEGAPNKEPDFVLVLRGGRILVIEVKGCEEEDIVAIDGEVWTMAPGWPAGTERPRTQARGYAIVLKEALAARGAAVWVDWRVALPFVSASEWYARRLPDQGGAALFKEDLRPERLRTLLAPRTASGPALPLMVEALGDVFGSAAAAMAGETGGIPDAAPPGSGCPTSEPAVIRLTYSGRPPTDEELDRELTLGPSEGMLYLTATAALEKLRAPRFGGGVQRLQFGPAIRGAMKATGQYWLSRVEQRVCLLRALDDPASSGAELRLRLRRDAAAWFDALVELDEEGRFRGGPPLDPAKYVDPAVADLLGRLHDRAMAEADAAREGRLPFEAAALRWLEEAFEPPRIVVMEGFTRLTHLQRAFIRRCITADTRLALIVPGSEEQRRGFAAVEAEHRRIAPRLDRHLSSPTLAVAGTTLQHVQRYLFAASALAFVGSTKRTVVTRTLPTRSAEAEFALRYVRRLRAKGFDLRWRVAVVATDPTLYEALMREEDSLQPEAVRLFAPQPRNLLLTPVGRFIINLYAVGQDGPLDMTAAQFRELLASGWLGARAAASAELFPSVAAQLLNNCRTEADWRQGLVTLGRLATGGRSGTMPPTRRRLPSNFITRDDVGALENALSILLELRRRLFAGPRGTIGEHARRLLSELERLDVMRLDQTVREVMRQIRTALAEMEQAGALDVEAREFGEVLRGLGQADEPGDEDDPLVGQNGLHVVGLEQVDGAEYDVIVALGLDDTQMPGGSLDRWPRTQEPASEWIARQRYRFLAVIRAARRRLLLLRPQLDGDAPCRDSPFLRRVAALLPQTKATDCACDPGSVNGSPRDRPRRAQMTREHYTVEELSIASLCEHRWRLEALEPRVRRFTDTWQLSWLARADWTAAVVERVAATARARQPAATLLQCLQQAKSDVEAEVRERFGGLSDFEWQGISREVNGQLQWLRRTLLRSEWHFDPPRIGQSVVDLGRGRRVTVHARAQAIGPSPRYTLFIADRDGAWISGGGKDPLAPLHPLYLAVQRFTNWSNWILKGGPVKDLTDVIRRIEALDGVRNPGPHCGYCPVRPRCLGTDP
jgi:hypothetical protein